MTKKNLRPQQVAPVQRETTANSSVGEKGVQALIMLGHITVAVDPNGNPFAGDDAE